MGTAVMSACCAALVSSKVTGPRPVPQSATVSPGLAALEGVAKPLPSVAMASPAPDWLAVKTPKLFCTTVIGAVALVRPLYVTVTVPRPAGVDDGRIAATWVGPA